MSARALDALMNLYALTALGYAARASVMLRGGRIVLLSRLVDAMSF